MTGRRFEMREEYDFNQGIKNPYTKEQIHFVGSDEPDTKDMTDRTIEYYNDNTPGRNYS